MYIVHVHIHVKADCIEDFRSVSLENAQSSLQEPGVARFDVLQQSDDPTRFLLLEVYRTATAALEHKDTAHYRKWREAAEPMMEEARSRMVYTNLFPTDESW